MPAPSPVFGSAPNAPRCFMFQHGERLADDLVRLAALDIDDHADAARVVLAIGE